MWGLRYREHLPAGAVEEFEGLSAWLRAFLSQEHNRDGTHRIGIWEPYDVRWATGDGVTAPSIGDGELTARWARIGGTVFYTIQLFWGPTTNGGSGTWTFSLPAVPAGAFNIGQAYGLDATPGTVYPAVANVNRTPRILTVSDGNGPWDASTPFTWADGDGLLISGFFEAPN